MKMLTYLLSSLFLIILTVNLEAQVISRIKQPPPNRLTISDLWELQLINTTRKEIKGYVVGTLSEANIGLIAEGRSKTITIKPGNNTYSYKDFSNADVNFTNNQYKEIFLRSGNAPEGDYTICITVYNESDEVIGQENCIHHSVRLAGNITLISPEDESEVDLEQPVLFSWSPLQGAKNFNIKIVEVLQGQSPLVAIEQNKSLVDETVSGRNNYLLNPSNLKSFLRGSNRRTYAWQVTSGESKSDVYVWKCCKSSMANGNEFDSLEIVVFNLCESNNVNADENLTKVMDEDCDDYGNLAESLSEIFNDESFVSEFKKVFSREQQNGILCRIIDHDGIRDTTNFDNKKVRFKAGAELADRVKKAAIGGGGRTIGAGQVTEILKLANRQSSGRNLLVLVLADNEAVLDSVFSDDNFETEVKSIVRNTFNNNDWDRIVQSETSTLLNLVIKTKSIPYKNIIAERQKKNYRITLIYPEEKTSEKSLNDFQNELEEFVRILIADEGVKAAKNVTTPKQTQGATFGERVNAGLINFFVHEENAEIGEEILILTGTPTGKTVPCPPPGCGCNDNGGESCSCKHWPGNDNFCLCKLCIDKGTMEPIDLLPPPNNGNGISIKDILIILKKETTPIDESFYEVVRAGLNKVSELRKNNSNALVVTEKYSIGVNEPGVN